MSKVVPVPATFYDFYMCELNLSETNVLMHLFMRVNGDFKNSIEESIAEISKSTNISKRSVLPALKSLECRGMITRIRNRDGKCGDMPTSYRINLDAFKPKEITRPSVPKPKTYKTTGIPIHSDNPGPRKRFLRSLGLSKCPPGYQVDHIIPKYLGGARHESNMQLLPILHHIKKSADESRARRAKRGNCEEGKN